MWNTKALSIYLAIQDDNPDFSKVATFILKASLKLSLCSPLKTWGLQVIWIYQKSKRVFKMSIVSKTGSTVYYFSWSIERPILHQMDFFIPIFLSRRLESSYLTRSHQQYMTWHHQWLWPSGDDPPRVLEADSMAYGCCIPSILLQRTLTSKTIEKMARSYEEETRIFEDPLQ